MIRIGPAGIPLSCKERTDRAAVIYTKNLGLSAMEVQFARGIRISDEEAIEVGDVARELDIEMHVHAPYYINLAGDERNIKMGFDKILTSGWVANLMNARTLVVHPGFYGNHSKEETMSLITKNVRKLRDSLKMKKIETKIGIETMGKKDVFGSLNEIIHLCKKISGIVPVINFAHIHARGNGCLKEKKDFEKLFEKLEELPINRYLGHLTGVAYDEDGELHHIPIRKGDINYDALMDCLLENDYDITLISESPILEHDAVYAQLLLNRAMERK